MEEADFLCNRIAIMDHGKIVALDTPAGLKGLLRGDVITMGLESEPDGFIPALKEHAWIAEISPHTSGLTITVADGETRIPEIFAVAHRSGVTITSVNLRKPSLEDVFLHLTGSSIREESGTLHSHIHAGMRRRMMQ
jgi:ABC-2 type transport system ATP-binding protein